MQLHDLDRVEERRRQRGETHHEHGTHGEVRSDEHPRPVGLRQPTTQRRQPLVVEPGGADDGVDAVADAELEVVHDHVRVGEVHDGLGPGVDQCPDRVTGVDRGHQLHVGRFVDRQTDLAADLSTGSEHGDAELGIWSAHGPNLAPPGQPAGGGA